MKNTEKLDHLSLKRFVLYTVVNYPIFIVMLVERDRLIELLGSQTLFYILSLVFFFVLGWVFSQKNFSKTLAIIMTILGIMYWHFGSAADIPIWMSVVGYAILYLPATTFQFMLWFPFLLRFIWVHRDDPNNLRWE